MAENTNPPVNGGAIVYLSMAVCIAAIPMAGMFWSDRYGQLKDPFGVTWAVNASIAT